MPTSSYMFLKQKENKMIKKCLTILLASIVWCNSACKATSFDDLVNIERSLHNDPNAHGHIVFTKESANNPDGNVAEPSVVEVNMVFDRAMGRYRVERTTLSGTDASFVQYGNSSYCFQIYHQMDNFSALEQWDCNIPCIWGFAGNKLLSVDLIDLEYKPGPNEFKIPLSKIKRDEFQSCYPSRKDPRKLYAVFTRINRGKNLVDINEIIPMALNDQKDAREKREREGTD